MKQQRIYWIDLFSGAGGTSTGIHLANQDIIACVNHDAKAIASHKANYPKTLHFTEDVRDFKVVEHLKVLVDNLRDKQPDCYINIWASLECTNYSKAKGNLPRDVSSRTLAWDLMMYIDNLNPDFLYIENVREFMSWGKLDENGKPIREYKGCDYTRWICAVQNKGYNYSWKMLNAADFGAYTSRDRYFGIFAKKGLPISFPETTHFDPRKQQQSSIDLFENKRKIWKPVKEVLNFNIEGKDIFTRKKPLSEATLQRIYEGLIKFVANGNEKWILEYDLTNQSNQHKPFNIIINPNKNINTINNQELDLSYFLSTYYKNGTNREINLPSPTLTTRDRISKISYLKLNYNNFNNISQFPYLISTEQGQIAIKILDNDTETTIKIKKFMAIYGIIAIKMRMLLLSELKKIQGFPENYKLKGTQTDQKKQIGNSVVPIVAQKLAEVIFKSLSELSITI